MPPALVVDSLEVEEEVPTLGARRTSLRANWRIIALTLYLGISLFEYGFDKGAIAGFQAMPGFLHVFGYQSRSGAWNIEVRRSLCSQPPASADSRRHIGKTDILRMSLGNSTANHFVLHDPWRLHRLPSYGANRIPSLSPILHDSGLTPRYRRCRRYDCHYFVRGFVLFEIIVRYCQRLTSELLHGLPSRICAAAYARSLFWSDHKLDHYWHHYWDG